MENLKSKEFKSNLEKLSVFKKRAAAGHFACFFQQQRGTPWVTARDRTKRRHWIYTPAPFLRPTKAYSKKPPTSPCRTSCGTLRPNAPPRWSWGTWFPWGCQCTQQYQPPPQEGFPGWSRVREPPSCWTLCSEDGVTFKKVVKCCKFVKCIHF